MCCIFTWLAWAFDATHRIVVFFMACLISSSICCLLLTASLAGVAMGYNYSLAEYIDLKETNISVYIKRGVYDDEISDDFDWRRQAGGEANIQHKDTGLRTAVSEGLQPLAPGRRRMPDSVFESDDQHKYEGSLMRLTATPTSLPIRRFQPEPPYTTSSTTTRNLVDGLLAVADNLPGGSMDRLKAIQAAARHHEARKIELATAQFPEDASERQRVIEANAQIHDARRNDPVTTTDKYARYFSQLAVHPRFPGSGLNARKFMESQAKDMNTVPPNRFRDAVFRGQLAGWPTGASPKPTAENFFEYEMNFGPSMPTPPTVKPLLVRPMGANAPVRGVWEITTEPPRPILRTKSLDSKEDVYDSPKVHQKPKVEDVQKKGRIDNDYDESQGLPSRKKRSYDKVSHRHKLYGSIFNNNVETNQRNLHAKSMDAELDIAIVKTIEDRSQNIQSTECSQKSELEHPNSTEFVTNEKMRNTSRTLNNTSRENNESVLVKQSVTKSLVHLNAPDEMKQVKVPSNARKRKKVSKGYDYRKHGNTQIKSIWWKISACAQENWNRIIMLLDKYVAPISVRKTVLSAKNENIDTNSTDSNQSFVSNLVSTLNNKRINEDKIDINKTNTATNLLETSTASISDRMTPQSIITKIMESTFV